MDDIPECHHWRAALGFRESSTFFIYIFDYLFILKIGLQSVLNRFISFPVADDQLGILICIYRNSL